MFKIFFYQPIINILYLIFNFIQDFGFSIIITTVLIRMILWPLFTQNEQLQKKMQKIQPEIKKIQAEHKKDPQKQTALLLDVYKSNKVNPSFAFIFAIVQIFVIFGLFSAFTISIRPDFTNFLYLPLAQLMNTPISYNFLGIVDLSQPSLIFAIIATLIQLLQGFVTLKYLSKNDPQRNMLLTFTFVFPIIFILNYKHFKSVIFLYWSILTLVNIGQTLYIRHKFPKK